MTSTTRLNDWTQEFTDTVGTGPINLTGATSAGQTRFRDGLVAGEVYYSILDGADREAGIGIFDGVATITRTQVHAQQVNARFTDEGALPIVLSGNAVVSGTFNEHTYATMIDAIADHETRITQNEDDIAAIGGSGLDARVTQNEADIVINKAGIATNASDISTLSTDLAVLDADVSFRESAITALETGGTVTSNGPTSVLILAGSGEIIDSYNDTENQDTVDVTWLEHSFDLLVNAGMPVVTGLGVTFVGINSIGNSVAFPNGMTSSQIKKNIRLARVEYEDQVITRVFFTPTVSNQVGNTLLDFINFVDSSIKSKGLITRPTDIGDLTFWRDAGSLFVVGSNYENAKDDQNVFNAVAVGSVTVPVSYEPVTYNNGVTQLFPAATIVPDQVYEPAGAGSISTISNNNATIHYIVQSPGGNFYLSYGQKQYAGGYTDAVNNLFSDNSDHKFPAEFNGMFILAQMVVLTGAALGWDSISAGIYPTNSASTSSSGAGAGTQAINIGYTDTYSLGGNVQVAIDSLASVKLSQTQKAAVDNSDNPRDINPFITQTALDNATAPIDDIEGKNLVINGGFNVWQRGETFGSPLNVYTADVWFAMAGAEVTREFPNASETNANGLINIYRHVASAAAPDNRIYQVLEGIWPNEQMTCSFLVRTDTPSGRIVDLEFRTYSNDKVNFNSITTSTQDITDVWQRLTFTFTAPELLAGSNPAKAISMLFIRSRNDTNSVTYFADVQLELGNAATVFEQELVPVTLTKCYRYFWRGAVEDGTGFRYGVIGDLNMMAGYKPFPVEMYSTPTVEIVTGAILDNCSNETLTVQSSEGGMVVRVTVSSTGSYRALNGIYQVIASIL